MDLDQCWGNARLTMDDHGLQEWELSFDNGKRRMGACHQYPLHGIRKITLSRHFVRLNDWEVMEAVVLHECAHALVGPNHGHDRVWRAKARELGVKPTACAAAGSVESPRPKYTAFCTTCDKVCGTAHRKGAQMRRGNQYHSKCGTTSRIVWRENA